MSLTGRALLILLAVLVIAVPIAGVRLWSVWTGRGRTVFRWGLFLVAQLAAVALTMVAANDYGQFYPNWADLFRAATASADGQVAVTVRSFGGLPDAMGADAGGATSAPVLPTPAGVDGSSPAGQANGRPGTLLRHGPGSSAGDSTAPIGRTPTSASEPPYTSDQAVAPGSRLGLDTGAGDLSASEAHAIAAGLHPQSPPDRWAERGTVVKLPIPGDNGLPAQLFDAYLPPSYFAGGPGAARLPMLELLTGYPGTPTSIVGKVHAVDALLADLATGAVSPMVYVMTRPVEPYPRDTECMDIPGGPSNVRYLAQDVPPSAAAILHLSVPAMGVIGYSTGGYCALKLAMTYPGTYAGAGSMGGYYAAEPGPYSGGDLYGGDPHVKDDADLIWRLEHLPPPVTAVAVATARDEKGRDGYKPAQRFLSQVRAPMAADEFVRAHGGHNFGTWSMEFPDMLRWMDKRIKATEGLRGSASPGRTGDSAHATAAEPPVTDRPRPCATATPDPSDHAQPCN
jgi:hypothetical protein